MDGLPEQTWLGWFGMHLLAPSIYEILGEMIRDNVRDNGEFQLTRAQEIQRQREGYLALEMTGAQRFRLRRAGRFRGQRAGVPPCGMILLRLFACGGSRHGLKKRHNKN